MERIKSHTTLFVCLIIAFLGLGIAGFYLKDLDSLLRALESGERSVASAHGPIGAAGVDTMVNVGQVLVNVDSEYPEAHFLRVQMNLETFDEKTRDLVLEKKTAIRNQTIELLREQRYDSLKTLRGKLYFKEKLTSLLNEFLQKAAIKQVHFEEFYLQ